MVVSALDEIAWILNLRGSDIDYNPLFFSYLIIEFGEKIKVTIYADASKLEGVKDYLDENGVSI